MKRRPQQISHAVSRPLSPSSNAQSARNAPIPSPALRSRGVPLHTQSPAMVGDAAECFGTLGQWPRRPPQPGANAYAKRKSFKHPGGLSVILQSRWTLPRDRLMRFRDLHGPSFCGDKGMYEYSR